MEEEAEKARWAKSMLPHLLSMTHALHKNKKSSYRSSAKIVLATQSHNDVDIQPSRVSIAQARGASNSLLEKASALSSKTRASNPFLKLLFRHRRASNSPVE
jgi:hypothetical protein